MFDCSLQSRFLIAKQMSRATDVGAEDTKDPSETYQGLGYAVKTSCMLLNCDHA